VSGTPWFLALHRRHQPAFDVAFFLGGFAFDALLLRRIDDGRVLVQQGVYLALACLVFLWDHVLRSRGVEPSGRWARVASMRVPVLHFFLGTLLNAFLVFYFRASASLFSFLFTAALAVGILVNELPRFRQQGQPLRLLLISFSVTSYLAYVIPMAWGELERWHYFSAVAAGSLAAVLLWAGTTLLAPHPGWRVGNSLVPAMALQAVLSLAYWSGAIPPVPLSLKELSLNTSVEPRRTERGLHYALQYQPAPVARWFWPGEDETFVGPEGAKVWAFARVFAPTRFKEQVEFHWDFEDARKRWVPAGQPYLASLEGGNETGYRTFAYLTLGPPGRYRVRVLTEDGREIGSRTFRHVQAPPPASLSRED
jgi:hypothetical protein